MEWKEFLNHPEVFDTGYHHAPTGRDLCGKILHDVLEYLHTYEACAELVSSLPDIPGDVQQWFSRWNPSVRTWLSDLMPLAEHLNRIPDADPGWPGLIANIGQTLVEVSMPDAEAQTLILPSDDKSRHRVKVAIRTIARLNFIHRDIQDQEYIRLWTTNYKDFDAEEYL